MPDSPLTLNYPASLDTVVSGGEVANRAFTTLSDILNDTDLSVPLTSGTLFPSTGVITLTDSLTAPTKTEDIIYTANSASTLTVPTGGRGAFGSTAQNWSGTVYVRMRMMAQHHEWARDAILQLEAIVGADATPLASRYATISHNHSGVYEPANANIQAHIASTSNPHSVTKNQVGLGSVENTALSTWAGSTNLTTLGTISAGTWNGAVIGAAYGGAGSINGILKANGSGTVSAAVAGTDYLSATAPGSSGQLLYNNANAYAAASLVNYAASGSPALAVTGNASGAAFIRESTSSASPILVAAFPALFTLQMADGNTFWQMAYTSDASPNSFANYLQNTGELTFDCYRSVDDASLGNTHILPFGGIGINNASHTKATFGMVYQSGDDIYALGRDGGFDLSETPANVDLTWGSRGITFRAPASAIADGSIAASHLHFYQDETADTLSVKWKESGGTVHSLTFGASGANAALSNLSAVSINASLIPQTTLNLGAQATPWKNLWLYGGGTFGSHSIKLDGTPTAHRTITFPDATDTVAVLGTAQTWTANQTFGSGNLIATSAALTTPAITTSATVTRNSVGVTSTDGLVLTNTTAAAEGAQQYSPRLRLTGQGWKTNSTAASQTVDWIVENQPVQGAANPTTSLIVASQINGAGYATTLTVSPGSLAITNGVQGTSTLSVTSGALTTSGAISAVGNVSWGNGWGLLQGGGGATAIITTAGSIDIRITPTSRTLIVGGADAASPGAYTIATNNVVAGTSNTAGANWTFKASAGTGSAAGGSMLWQVAPAGSSGTTQNTFFTAMTLAADKTLTFGDAVNLVMGTTTGTKIGTATGQKIGFWNQSPITQPSSTGETAGFTAGGGTAVKDDSTFTGNVGSTAYRISDVVKALKQIGLLAS